MDSRLTIPRKIEAYAVAEGPQREQLAIEISDLYFHVNDLKNYTRWTDIASNYGPKGKLALALLYEYGAEEIIPRDIRKALELYRTSLEKLVDNNDIEFANNKVVELEKKLDSLKNLSSQVAATVSQIGFYGRRSGAFETRDRKDITPTLSFTTPRS